MRRSNFNTYLAFPTLSMPRDKKRVGVSHAVQLSIVCTHSVTPIWFRIGTPSTITWLDEVVIEQILNLNPSGIFAYLDLA